MKLHINFGNKSITISEPFVCSPQSRHVNGEEIGSEIFKCSEHSQYLDCISHTVGGNPMQHRGIGTRGRFRLDLGK